MKTPEEIKKGLEYLSCTNVAEKVERAKRGLPYAYAEDIAADALALIHQLEAKLAEYEKPLEPMTLEEVVEKSKNVSDNAIWLETPDEDTPDDTDCLPALVSNFSGLGANCIEYIRFLMWPNEKVVFPVTEGTEYGSSWRCWPRKPTDEERKAAKWDE